MESTLIITAASTENVVLVMIRFRIIVFTTVNMLRVTEKDNRKPAAAKRTSTFPFVMTVLKRRFWNFGSSIPISATIAAAAISIASSNVETVFIMYAMKSFIVRDFKGSGL